MLVSVIFFSTCSDGFCYLAAYKEISSLQAACLSSRGFRPINSFYSGYRQLSAECPCLWLRGLTVVKWITCFYCHLGFNQCPACSGHGVPVTFFCLFNHSRHGAIDGTAFVSRRPQLISFLTQSFCFLAGCHDLEA